jgi:hypothetical protein
MLRRILFILAFPVMSFGHATGPDPGVNGVFGTGTTCAQAGCHSTSPLNSGTGSVVIEGLPTSWSPGQTYPLTVTVRRQGAAVYGFQLSAVRNATSVQAGVLALNSSSSRVSIRTSGGLQYAQHNLPIVSGTFSFNWVAPSDPDVGAIRFNVAGNSANGDGTNSGDVIYARAYNVDAAATAPPPPPPPPPVQTFYYPQIASGVQNDKGFWKTTIFLYNPSSTATATGAVTFTTSGGAPFGVAFVDASNNVVSIGNTIPFTLGPGVSRRYVSTAAEPLTVGYATVTSSAEISGNAIFSQFSPGGALLGEAGVPAAATFARQSILVDAVNGFQTGVAYANPGSTDANITLQLINTEGVATAIKQITLPAGRQSALFVSEVFTLLPGFVGTMQILSNNPFAAIALRFDSSLNHFTTVPPAPLQ